MCLPNTNLICSILTIILIPCLAQANELKLAANTWPPYIDQKLPEQGLAMEVVNTALERAGYTTSLEITSWPRTLQGTRIGYYDAIVAAWYTEDRAVNFTFSKPYLLNQIKFMKRRDWKFSYHQLSDLRGLRIGIVNQYAYDDAFENSTHFIKVINNHVIQNLLSLLQGRIQLTVGDELVLKYELKQFLSGSMHDFEFVPRPLTVKGLHLAVNKLNPKHQSIAEDFDREIEAMRKEGKYAEIISKHTY